MLDQGVPPTVHFCPKSGQSALYCELYQHSLPSCIPHRLWDGYEVGAALPGIYVGSSIGES